MSVIYCCYKWQIYTYNAKTSKYDVEYYSKICLDKVEFNKQDLATLEDWKCRNEMYNSSRNEWFIGLLINLFTLTLATITIKRTGLKRTG